MTKTRMIIYWTTTGMLVLALASSGVAGLAQHPEHVKVLAHLGYPAYFGVILGFWKILGAMALLVPGKPQLKEWAYAGVFFNMTGASVSHVVCGDSFVQVIAPLVFVAFAIVSWSLRAQSRRVWIPGPNLSSAVFAEAGKA